METGHSAVQNGLDSDALFRALVATSVDGIMVIDEAATVLVYSEACMRLFGYAPDEVLGHNVKILMPEPYHAEHDGYLMHYKSTGEKHIIGIGREVTGRRKGGTTFPMYLSVGEGQLGGRRIFVGIVHDISDERERERQIQALQNDLLHATRVTAMGQMSSAIAHELNQPLTAILSYAGAMQRMIDRENPPLAEIRDGLAKTAKDAARAGEIIRRLRAFVEKREPQRTREPLGPLIMDAVSLGAVGLAADGVKVEIQIDPDIPPPFLDKVQIQQVLVNLIRNAVDAMRDVVERRLKVTAAREDGFAVISVTDTGTGVAPEVALRLFEAFASTKDDGMGIGLSISRTIVEAHGGRIWAEASVGGGAIFRFRVPLEPGTV